jgi:hypothetical protein
MGFWPTGPITTTMAVIILVTATAFFIWGRKEQRFIAAALLLSWIGARWTTETENIAGYAIFLTVSSGLCFTSFTLISRYIGIIYAIRLINAALLASGAINWFWHWELNLWLVAVQILLAWGTIASGSGTISKRNGADRSIDSRRRITPVIRAIWPRKAPLSKKAQTNGKAYC